MLETYIKLTIKEREKKTDRTLTLVCDITTPPNPPPRFLGDPIRFPNLLLVA
jgi:hypothetical protein